MKISGLVLCGGKSTRMGTDKGSLLKEGKPWARIVCDQLTALDIPCKISVNKDQLKDYSAIFNEEVLIADQLDIPGPLRGILSAHRQYPEINWLIVACDMIDMNRETLIKIINAEHQAPGSQFYVYKGGTYYEPFGGIYSAAGLHQIDELYRQKLLKDFSLQHVLNTFETYTLLTEISINAFKNYNF